jgi:hypothetical protein
MSILFMSDITYHGNYTQVGSQGDKFNPVPSKSEIQTDENAIVGLQPHPCPLAVNCVP